MPYKERTTIGHDPETDVHVLVHGREKGGKSVPHDHGPCWVIYGNYKNPTRMRRWRRVRHWLGRLDHPLAPVAVWAVTFALHLAGGRLLHLPRIKLWPPDA